MDQAHKIFNFCFCLLVITLFCCVPPRLLGQENELMDLTQQWAEIQKTYASKNSQLLADPTNKDLKNEVEELVAESKELVPRLKNEALTQLQESPKDASLFRQVMGILIYQASQGDDLEVLQTGERLIELEINPRYFEIAARTERLSISGREIFEELLIRQREASNDDLPRVKLNTSKGPIVIELFEDQAPNTVANFVSLVESGHFNGVLFHRVIDGFMAQAGERKLDGTPVDQLSYTIACECLSPETRRHFTNSVSMAHAGPNTGAGQFFLTFRRTSHLDGRHTCFGRIIEGAEVLNSLIRTHSLNDQELPDIENDSIQSAEILRKRDHQYPFRKFGQPEPKTDPSIDEIPATPSVETDSQEAGGFPDLPNRDEVNSEADSQNENLSKRSLDWPTRIVLPVMKSLIS